VSWRLDQLAEKWEREARERGEPIAADLDEEIERQRIFDELHREDDEDQPRPAWRQV
jgi:hypothetical protein